MKVLVIYAHPNPESFTHAVLEQLQRGLTEARHDIQTIDLYQEAFDPVLVIDSTRRRRDLIHDAYTERYRRLLVEADQLIFVYPIWWHSMPAMMRGFIERTFVSGLAYTYKGRSPNKLLPTGLLSGRSVWCIYTLDAPKLVAWLDPGWLSIKYSIFWYCGLRKIRRDYMPGLKRTTLEQRRDWLEIIYQKAVNLR